MSSEMYYQSPFHFVQMVSHYSLGVLIWNIHILYHFAPLIAYLLFGMVHPILTTTSVIIALLQLCMNGISWQAFIMRVLSDHFKILIFPTISHFFILLYYLGYSSLLLIPYLPTPRKLESRIHT